MENSKNGLCNYLENELNQRISSKTLVRLYDKFILNKNGDYQASRETLNQLAQHLNFQDFANFCRQNQQNSTSTLDEKSAKSKTSLIGKNSLMASAAVLGFAGLVFNHINTQNECMYWNQSQYVEVDCKENHDFNTEVIPIDQKMLSHFKQIQVNPQTEFFVNGEPQVCFSKSQGEIQYFSAPGLHPTNGKTLKPITQYMIDKYVLKKYQ